MFNIFDQKSSCVEGKQSTYVMIANQQANWPKLNFSVFVDFARFESLVEGRWNCSALLLTSTVAYHHKTVKSAGNLPRFYAVSYFLHQLEFDKLFSVRQPSGDTVMIRSWTRPIILNNTDERLGQQQTQWHTAALDIKQWKSTQQCNLKGYLHCVKF